MIKIIIIFTIIPGGGNTSGNLANAGVICEKDGWIYFLNSSDNEKLYKINADDSGMTKISDDSPLFINIEGDWIYYSNMSDNYTLYKIRLDGKNKMKLNDTPSGFINTVKNNVFYADYTKDNVLTKRSIYNSEKDEKSYTANNLTFINSANDRIYFEDLKEDKIMKMDAGQYGWHILGRKVKDIPAIDEKVYQSHNYAIPTTIKVTFSDGTEGNLPIKWDSSSYISIDYYADTSKPGKYTLTGNVEGYDKTDLKRLTDPPKGYIFSMVLKDGYICYNNSGINKINLSDLSGTVLLSDASITTYGVEDGFVYYSKSSGVSQQIWKLSIDGKTNIPITPESESYSFIRVDNGWIYAENMLDNGFTYKMKTDGSSKQLNYRF